MIIKQSKRVLLPCFAHYFDVLQVILNLDFSVRMILPVLLEIAAKFWEVLLDRSYLVLTVDISSVVTIQISLVSTSYHSSRTCMLVRESLLVPIQ